MSLPNEIYLNFAGFIGKQQEANKGLRQNISNYQKIVQNGNSNTVSLESEIEREIKNLKEVHSKLNDAYSNRNAPSQIPGMELDRRQKEIQKLGLDIQNIENTYKNINNQKYAFKGSMDGEYQQSEEMKTMSNSELLQLQKNKIKEQDEQLDEITLEVKKGRVLAKEAGHIIDEQNKQLDTLQEEIDRLDSRFKRGIKRFENYVAKQSTCCIIMTLIIEAAIAFLIFFILS